MKISLCILAAALSACCLLPGLAGASGYEFDGIGARSMARGGAVIADAADWSAIYWNPANLADVKAREAGLELKAGNSHSYDGNSFNVKSPALPNESFSKKHQRSSFFFGSMGTAIPLNTVSALGVGVYLPLLQGSNFEDTSASNTLYNRLDYEGFAAILVMNVSYARKVSDKVSLSLGLNAIRGSISSDAEAGLNFPPSVALIGAYGLVPGTLRKEMSGSGYGLEGISGVKYNVSDKFSLGAVFRTGATVNLEGESEASFKTTVEKSDFKFTLKQPPTSGVGFAWKHGRKTVLTFDFTQTWWRGFSSKTTYDSQGELLVNQPNTFDWKNSYKLRAGALWAYDERTDFMAGWAYDTPAIDAGSLDHSSAIDVHMHRFSAAVSRRWGGLEATLGGLAGNFTSREAGGVKYGLGGGYAMGELKYKF